MKQYLTFVQEDLLYEDTLNYYARKGYELINHFQDCNGKFHYVFKLTNAEVGSVSEWYIHAKKREDKWL